MPTPQGAPRRPADPQMAMLLHAASVRFANIDTSWMTDAACRGQDTDIFYAPHTSERARRLYEAHAKQLCRGCPVRDDCLSYALRVNEPDGVWGGLNLSERQRLRRKGHR